MKGRFVYLMCFVQLVVTSFACAAAAPKHKAAETHLQAAEKFVEASDRYLHHSKLGRGMKGYGLTVMAGTEIVRFDVEIVSVMTKWGPHQDVILARLSGLEFETTSIISGMSGSPVYVRHEGTDKLIGAVAYGWSMQKEAQCGIQPITQMLAVGGFVPGRTVKAAKRTATQAGPCGGLAPAEFIAAVLNPKKSDFSTFAWPRQPAAGKASAHSPRLSRLTTPLMVSSIDERAFATLGDYLRPMGIVPVRSGGLGSGQEAQGVKDARLQPGSGISVPLVSGDVDFAGVGTVTEVVGRKVLAFGHPFFAEGEINFPMGPAYVHTVIASVQRSFKIGSTLKVTGSLNRDESAAVAGVIGPKVSMIPMTVRVRSVQDDCSEVFRYRLVSHRWLTPMLTSVMVRVSAWTRHRLPPLHTVRYVVEIDFGELGLYRSSNVFSGDDVGPAASDAARPLAAMLNNPLGPPPEVRSISADITIEPVQKTAEIVGFHLDGRIYRPGETVTGRVTLRPFRKPKIELPVQFDLPQRLPDGTYKLTACDYTANLRFYQREMPQRFRPRTVQELFRSIQRVVAPAADRLYLRLPLGRSGLAVGSREMPDLPESKARILSEADLSDMHKFTQTLVRSLPSDYVLRGTVMAEFQVRRQPKETRLREGTKPQ
ncbi:MAG: hypothetical protein SVT52_00715 [Planctomycetota bacterium]|nr:hypothetical protein [Planctomycetota bacterium]